MSTTHNSTRGMTLTNLTDLGAVLDCQTLSPASETPAGAKEPRGCARRVHARAAAGV